jgi:hypothetical protein
VDTLFYYPYLGYPGLYVRYSLMTAVSCVLLLDICEPGTSVPESGICLPGWYICLPGGSEMPQYQKAEYVTCMVHMSARWSGMIPQF